MPRVRRLQWTLPVLLALLWSFPAAYADNHWTELLEEVDLNRAVDDNFTFVIDAVNPEGKRFRLRVRVRDRVKSLVRYLEPRKSKGRAVLMVGENLWVYIPGTRNALRISANQQLMGGVSIADVARTVFSVDFAISERIETSADSALAGGVMTSYRLSPRHRKTAYGRIDLTIDDRKRPLRAVYYSLSGRKLKTAYFGDYTMQIDRLRPAKVTVIDHTRNEAITTLHYTEMRIEDTPEQWYQSRFLSRLP